MAAEYPTGAGAAAPQPEPVVARRPLGPVESVRASRAWWDRDAADYDLEHRDFLGEVDFVWGPEGLREAEAALLGDVEGARILEIGCGSAPCARWLAGRGARPVGLDLSAGMLRVGAAAGRRTGVEIPLIQADAGRLPFVDGSFDHVCSAYGAIPFVADSAGLLREAARVLRPGGRLVFSVTHPLRWALRDDPGPAGLQVVNSYFDRTPYVESDEGGRPSYVEHHRTVGDRVREISAAGLVLHDLIEPEWPDDNTQVWGGWSPLRGALIPGTAIFCCRKV